MCKKNCWSFPMLADSPLQLLRCIHPTWPMECWTSSLYGWPTVSRWPCSTRRTKGPPLVGTVPCCTSVEDSCLLEFQQTVESQYLEDDGTIFYKFKLPEVQIKKFPNAKLWLEKAIKMCFRFR